MGVEGVQTIQTVRPVEMNFDVGVPLPEPSQAPQEEKAGSEQNLPIVPDKFTNSVIQFTEDAVSGKIMIRVVDQDSGEVVRQIPPEELVAISRVLGLLFDRVA